MESRINYNHSSVLLLSNTSASGRPACLARFLQQELYLIQKKNDYFIDLVFVASELQLVRLSQYAVLLFPKIQA
jgi:hypothetical protein